VRCAFALDGTESIPPIALRLAQGHRKCWLRIEGRISLKLDWKSSIAALAVAAAIGPSMASTALTAEQMPRLGANSAENTGAAEETSTHPEHGLGETFKDCEECPEMMAVPAGEFTMGSPPAEKDRTAAEGPQHSVRITVAFAMGKFEVTRAQFEAFVDDSGYQTGSTCWTLEDNKGEMRPGRSFYFPGLAQEPNHPVVCVSWEDAKAYANWLSQKTGKSYLLPSEADWEYTARAGSISRYSFGDEERDLCAHANVRDVTAKKPLKASIFANCKDGYLSRIHCARRELTCQRPPSSSPR
jgi:formylglycine-generating enzyme required for sulfatase activity